MSISVPFNTPSVIFNQSSKSNMLSNGLKYYPRRTWEATKINYKQSQSFINQNVSGKRFDLSLRALLNRANLWQRLKEPDLHRRLVEKATETFSFFLSQLIYWIAVLCRKIQRILYRVWNATLFYILYVLINQRVCAL